MSGDGWCVAGTDIPYTDERARIISDALGAGTIPAATTARGSYNHIRRARR